MKDNASVHEEDNTAIIPELEQSDEAEEDIRSPLRTKRLPARRILMNISRTQYPIITQIGKSFKWKLTSKEEDEN